LRRKGFSKGKIIFSFKLHFLIKRQKSSYKVKKSLHLLLEFGEITATNVADSAYPSYVAVGILPLQVIIPKLDSSGAQIDGEFVIANELKVAKLENSITVEKHHGQPINEEIDIDKDIDRFYIRILGGADIANGKEFFVKLKTAENGKAQYNDDETKIKLNAKDGDLISKSLILTADQVDDDFSGAVDVAEDDAENDRTHIVQLGGHLLLSKILIGNDQHEINLNKSVQLMKRVTVNFVILNDGNINVENVTAEIERDLEVMNERFAQVGIEVVSGGISSVSTPAGLDLPNNQLRANISGNNFTGRVLSNDCKAVINACGTVGNVNDIHVIYSPYQIADHRGEPALGISLNHYFNEEQNDAGYLSNALITIGQPLKITLGHEVGHILGEDHIEVWLFNEPNIVELWPKRSMNLMTAEPVDYSDTKISGSRRLWKVQETRMRANAHSKDP
jgi:hypothetical protein